MLPACSAVMVTHAELLQLLAGGSGGSSAARWALVPAVPPLWCCQGLQLCAVREQHTQWLRSSVHLPLHIMLCMLWSLHSVARKSSQRSSPSLRCDNQPAHSEPRAGLCFARLPGRPVMGCSPSGRPCQWPIAQSHVYSTHHTHAPLRASLHPCSY